MIGNPPPAASSIAVAAPRPRDPPTIRARWAANSCGATRVAAAASVGSVTGVGRQLIYDPVADRLAQIPDRLINFLPGSVDELVVVEELEAGHIAPGERVALLALASGLEIGVVLLTLDEDLVSRYGHSH